MSARCNVISNIVDFLMKKEDSKDCLSIKREVTDMDFDVNMPDQFLDDAWPSSPDELLENIFSLDSGLLDGGLDGGLHHGGGLEGSLSGSDSGLSMDHADFDMMGLPPLLGGSGGGQDDVWGPTELHSPLSALSPSPPPPQITLPAQTVLPTVRPLQTTLSSPPTSVVTPQQVNDGANLKRKNSIPTNAVIMPKIQKNCAVKRDNSVTSNMSNCPRILLTAGPGGEHGHKKVIRVAPTQVMGTAASSPNSAGHPRSILLPLTLKDVKELRTIKIINASDLKNSASIKLAAANFLQQSRQAQRDKAARSATFYTATSYDSDDHQNVSGEGNSSGRSSGEEADYCEERDGEGEHEEGEEDEGQEGEGKQFPRLRLTPEERRLLQREGVALPARYPLTRGEERELKRIRRKIRNKISAQDSRRRKKEYVDGLEDRVKQCTHENQNLMKRIKVLQSQNHTLSTQLRRLQSLMSGSGGKLGTGTGASPATPAPAPATCLMVLLLSLALVVAPNLRPSAPASAPGDPHTQLLSSIRRALLSASPAAPAHSPPLIVSDDITEEEVALPETVVLVDHTYPLPASPIYADLSLDGEPSLKLEKVEYDSDYGGSVSPPLLDTAQRYMEQAAAAQQILAGLYNSLRENKLPPALLLPNKNLTQPRSVVVSATEVVPMLR